MCWGRGEGVLEGGDGVLLKSGVVLGCRLC